jgi:hypothetical protein
MPVQPEPRSYHGDATSERPDGIEIRRCVPSEDAPPVLRT